MDNYYDTEYEMRAQGHTHELSGSTEVAGPRLHTHRIANITSQPIQVTGGHVHEIVTNTTFDLNHLHRITVRTGLQIPVGNNKHVHNIRGITTLDSNHSHDYELITFLE